MAGLLNPDSFARIIDQAVQQEIERAIDLEMAGFQERVAKIVRAQVAAISLTVLNQYAVERSGNDLIIRVKIEEPRRG